MKKTGKRLGALLMALVMIVSLVPVTALAARVENDAVEIAAPDTSADNAKPAGAVDAADIEDVPAVLAEGETNIARQKPVYVSGIEADTLMPAQGVDNNTNTHWGSSKMKDGGGQATAENAVSWFVVDLLGDDNTIAVDHITSITMKFNARVWPEACRVQVAKRDVSFADYTEPSTNGTMMHSSDYEGTRDAIDNENWITIADFEKSSSGTHGTDQNIIMSTTYSTNNAAETEIAPKSGTLKMEDIPEDVRYVRVYFTAINATSPGTCIGMKELDVQGVIKDVPLYTEANINAGLFDVGAKPTKNAEGVWSANYSPTANGVTIEATAASYHNVSNPNNVVDDDNTESMWHTRWPNDPDTAGTGPAASLENNEAARYIQLNLSEATEISALRYLPADAVNGIVTRYRIEAYNAESDSWVVVATANDTTNWDAANSNKDVWYIAHFDEPVTTTKVRLYGVVTKSAGLADGYHMTGRKVRLVKAGAATYSISGKVVDSSDAAIAGATVSVGNKSAATGSDGRFTLEGLSYPTCTASVTKDGYKTRAAALDAESEGETKITLYAPLSGDALTGVNNHLWDYPLWAESADAIHGGSVTAFSWANTDNDLPPWAAIDGNSATLWHSQYTNSGGQGAAAGNVGKWYEFTLGTPTKIIGLWYMPRQNCDNQPGNVTIKVSNGETSPSGAEWAALPSAGSVSMNADPQALVFLELPAPVEAKYVRIYPDSPGAHVVIAELRVVMDPATSGAKHLTGTVKASGSNEAIVGATVKVGNHTATSGADGAYDLGYLPAGTYTVTASATGYKDKTQEVTVSGEGDLAPVDLALETQALTLNVTVTAGGNPVDGATVTLEQNNNGKLPVAGVAAVTGGTNGVYTLDATQAGMGTFVVRVSHPDYNIGTAEVTFNNTTTTASATVALTARSAPAGAGSELVKTYNFDNASEVDDFVPLVTSDGATVTHDATKGAMKITFVDDGTSYNNLILNKKFVIKNGSVEFDVTAEGTVAATSNFGSVWRYGDGKWLHVGQLDTVDHYGATTHSSATASASHNGGIPNVAMGAGVTRRFNSMLGLDSGGFKTERSGLNLESVGTGGWVYTHNAGALPISNEVGLWGFDAKNADGLVVYIDNLKVYRRTEQKGAVTIGELSGGTLTVKTVTELDAEGSDLATGDNGARYAFEGDTIQISATGVSADKVFAVKVTRTDAATTVVPVTKGGDGSFTFTMPAYPVTITPSAATQLTDVTVTGANYGEGNAKFARVGNTLTVSEGATWGEGVSYQWQYSSDGTHWTDIPGATAASFVLTNSQYNTSNTQNQVRVVVTGNDVAYTGTVASAAVDVKEGLVEVTGVTFARSNITMWSNYNEDPVESNGSEEGKTTVITATITPSTASRPMTVTWESSDTAVVSISNQSTTATETGTALTVSATLTALKTGTANITCTVTAKDGTAPKVATVRVTVKTAITEITLTGGGKTLNSAADVLTIYANDGDDDQSVDVTATVDQGADAEGLTWACNHVGEHIFVLGDTEDEGEAAGNVVTITAHNSHTLVGRETVTVTAPTTAVPTGVTAPSKIFTVEVVHKIDGGEHSVGITYTGTTPKVGTQLSVDLTNVPMSDTDKGKLTYQWKRTKAGTDTPLGTDKNYTLVADDVGGTITVTVTATADSDNEFYYKGSLTSNATAVVVKADGPSKPSLTSTPYSKDGDTITEGTIIIASPDENETYEYRVKDPENDTWGEWQDATLDNGVISGLSAGDYQVRIKANEDHFESVEEAVTVSDTSKTYLDVTVNVTPTAGGSAVRGSEKVEEGKSVTLTVKPNAGYQIDSVKNGEDTLTGTAGADGATVYTVSNVQANVAFTVTFTKIKVKIYHVLNDSATGEAGLTCSLGTDHLVSEGGQQYHEVDYATAETTITLNAAEGYNLPSIITVKAGTTDLMATGTDPVTYNNLTGVITFPSGVTQDITITATATAKTYTATFAPTGGSNLTGAVTSTTPIPYDTTLTATLTPATGYSVPAKENVTVTMGNNNPVAFTYTVNEGVATITVAHVTGNVIITASGVKITTSLDSVSIEINHDEPTVSNQEVPHVGDTLKAKPTAGDKTNVTATYEWYVDGTKVTDLHDPSGETYTVRESDKGKKIKVVATGTGDFSETVTSLETEPVGDKVFAVSGVKIQNNGSDVSAATPIEVTFGGTLQLTAVVTPDNATNKNVTWASSAPNVATVNATGQVTAAGVGEATITVTTEDGSRQATCKVRVTAKDLTNDATATVRVSGTLELGQTVNAVLVPADAANGASYSWYIVNADGSNETHIMDTDGANATLPTDSSNLGKKVKLVVTYGGNYTGSKTRITANGIAGELPTHDIRIASTITNGSVTASPTEAKAGVTVTLTVTPATDYELDTLTVTAGYYGTPVEIDKVNDTTYTFIMPDTLADSDVVNVTATFVKENETPPVADKDGLKALIDEVEALTEADYTAESWADLETALETAQAVYDDEDATEAEITEAATALEAAKESLVEVPTMDPTALNNAIKAAQQLHDSVVVAEKAEDVPSNKKFVTSQTVKDTLAAAIEAAKTAKDNAETQADLDSAKTALDTAVAAFTEACQQGTKKVATTRPTTTTTETKEDGTVVTTVTDNRTGTKTVTTEKPDGTVETVETKKDGTVIETVETPDGTKETVKTQPDGTVMETVVAPDGTKESVETKPDGTVTETVIDAEGAMTEKVTDPEENVTITVIDAEGEQLVKVELPATVEEPDTKFEDVEGHWAEDSINKIAALGLVNGTGDNKYGTESYLTRGELATVLYRMSQGKSGYPVTFGDVENEKYYTDGVAWAAKVKVVTGYTAEIFAPDDTITREQLAVMLCRYAKLIGLDTAVDAGNLDGFADGDTTSPWAVDGVAWCVANGILKGTGAEVLDPASHATRAQVAIMLDRFIGLIK